MASYDIRTKAPTKTCVEPSGTRRPRSPRKALGFDRPGRAAVGRWAGLLGLALLHALLPTPAAADTAEIIDAGTPITREWSLPDDFYLTGDWGGLRPDLAARGIAIDAFHTFDVFGVVAGGVHRRASFLGDFDLLLTVDGEDLLGWSGASALVYGLGTYGDNPSDDAGDSQGLDNIAAPGRFRLFEAWVLQEMFDGRLSALLGLYDVNGEFDVCEIGTVLINSAFGTGTDLAQSGRNGPSIFPVSGLAARLRHATPGGFYLQGAVVDGVPGDPDEPYGAQVSLPSDGAFVIAETGFHVPHEPGEPDASAHLAVGGWFYTTTLDRIAPAAPATTGRGSHGVYALVEGALWRNPSAPDSGLGGFLRLGWAAPDYNPFEWFVGAGLVYTGLVPSRWGDQLGFGVASAIAGGPTLDVAREQGEPRFGAEIALEWTYRLLATPWLALQPDLQWIVHPGLDPSLQNALVPGFRVEMAL